MDFENHLEKYAELAVKVGVNLQKGQTLVINSPISCISFVRKVVKNAYQLGAKYVHINWKDDEITLAQFQYASDEALQEYPAWLADNFETLAKEGAAFLTISADNPDLLKEVNPQKVANYKKAEMTAKKAFRNYILTDQVRWCVLSIPTLEWTAKIFPNLEENQRMQALWDTIFKVTRITENDPVEAWKTHVTNLEKRVQFLNDSRFTKLYFKGNGTDCTIDLPKNHLWAGGSSKSEDGLLFLPNIPTEEVFTLPSKTGVNGIVCSTKPLNYSGNIIDEFTLTFKEGRIIDFSAKEGYETLKNLIETDEGSHYLGEVALVPHHSPISDTNLIFYNTLFDENASCHLAIGAAYPTSLDGGAAMSSEELAEAGANTSLTHVDFMIGSDALNIYGETLNSEKIQIFKEGNWAF